MSNNKSFVRQQQLDQTITEKETTLELQIANKVDKVPGKSLSKNDLTDELKAQYDQTVGKAGKTEVRSNINLLPQLAKAVIPYGTQQSFTITALDPSSAGNGIQIVFEDPDGSLSQSLDVTVEDGVIIIDHATDETGAITTLAGNLVTAINTDIYASELVEDSMGDAGTVDHIGTVQTGGWVSGIVCDARHTFTDGTDFVVAIANADGSNNSLNGFMKVTMSPIE